MSESFRGKKKLEVSNNSDLVKCEKSHTPTPVITGVGTMVCLIVKNSYGRELCMTNIIIRLYVAAVNLVLNTVDLVKPVIRRMFKKPVATGLYLVFKDNKGFIRRGKRVSTVIRNDQQVSFALAFQDAHGNPVTELGSVPAWELDNADLATLEVSEDGMSAVVRPTGQIGNVNVFVRVDADPDEDVEELLGQASIAILAGKAKVIQLSGVIGDLVVTEDAPEEPVPMPDGPGGEAPVVPVQPEPVEDEEPGEYPELPEEVEDEEVPEEIVPEENTQE